ncbi:MAG: hypothetical protein HYZ27_04280, partial [Deltaproteobacteria bacterium]|nr:hypothetical protein [Deltaproteobacteria bacterium]
MRRLVLTVLLASCVSERIPVPARAASFRVDLVSIDPYTWPPGCENTSLRGSEECPRPFVELSAPLNARVRATALDHHGEPMLEFAGTALVDVRPGRLVGVGPGGLVAQFSGGAAEMDVTVAHAYGQVRIWFEDCGSLGAPGSFATGVSPVLFFEQPRIDQLNATTDNTTSPMVPRPTNVCAITGDPRFGLGVDENGEVTFVGHSFGGAVNAPPPAMGQFVDVGGCTSLEHASGLCRRGPVIVTALDNEGFYISDIHPAAVTRGFNHVYAFNFSYPDDLEVGDVLVSLRGSPVEFAGSTQLSNPAWQRDGVRRGLKWMPAAHVIEADEYAAVLSTYGRNDSGVLTLERYEGAVVCMDNLAPAQRLVGCDVNASGGIERQGCLVDRNAPLPPRCEVAVGTAPAYPACDETVREPYCFPMSDADLTSCALTGFLPNNPAEYCCERNCYTDFSCNESSSYVGFGQWVAEVYGRYEPANTDPPVKVAVVTRDALPPVTDCKDGFERGRCCDPFLFASVEFAKP